MIRLTLQLLLLAYAIQAADPIRNMKDDPYLYAQTENGPVYGEYNYIPGQKSFSNFFGGQSTLSRVFAGIPFALPPVGPLRFQSPQPITKSWGTVKSNGDIEGELRKAKEFPAACPQKTLSMVEVSEDCLYLNVFVPPLEKIPKDGKKLPVLVHLFGGSFIFGDSYTMGLYNGRHFTDKGDIILVTFNYRLGPFGFFASDDARGNYAIEDQRAALRWVKRNIAYFGGDPDNVTIHGISAGAISTMVHATSPATEDGLFHKIIHQSGPLGTLMKTKESIHRSSYDLAKRLNCLKNDKPDMDCLRNPKLSATDILKAGGPVMNDPQKEPIPLFNNVTFNVDSVNLSTQKDLSSEFFGDGFTWWPSIDGYNIVGQPQELLAQGKFKKVPILMGVQNHEGGFWMMPLDIPISGDEKRQKFFNAKTFAARLQVIFGKNYPAVSQLYPVDNSPETNVNRLIDLFTDYAFLCPSEEFAKTWSKDQKNVYFYRWTQPAFPPVPRCLKMSCHSNEVPYMFSSFIPLVGERREALKWAIQRYTVNFCATGNPNIKPDGSAETYPQWPAYTPTGRQRQELGDRIGSEEAQRSKFCEVINKLQRNQL